MTTTEQERQAYMAGDTKTAELLARIDALQRALGAATAQYERAFEALEELVAEADFPVGWDGHEKPNTYGFELARAVIAERQK